MEGHGERIQQRLRETGLRLSHLAKLVGVHPFELDSWINKGVEPGILKAYKLCHYLNCDINWLITGKNQSPDVQSALNKYEVFIIEVYRAIFQTFEDSAMQFDSHKITMIVHNVLEERKEGKIKNMDDVRKAINRYIAVAV